MTKESILAFSEVASTIHLDVLLSVGIAAGLLIFIVFNTTTLGRKR